ncbi:MULTISPECIES: chemotaxis protein CheD [Exiguobacterium]|uniref:chemotaxis protein CheD n=1 Tax=Exiguobacterium TaxID=33986 RepID=UPI001BE6F3BA|nr:MULTISPECIES: chemotaxis protein CheD [Exiguobacterium]MCT4776176.1 chemotaxis protein CheD [Exiguobacterium aquaticum]MCT4787952.1 chemotaxis protein CheD [Exiguobacterium mexicanum]
MAEVLKIGIAEWKQTTAPNKLRTAGLGSCVGVILYDVRLQVAAMAHVMLPDSAIARKHQTIEVGKYADTAIDALVASLKQAGAGRLQAKMAGGAQMFQFKYENEAMRIGERNAEAVRNALKAHRIPLIAEDCGGHNGRTIEFDVATCVLSIRTVSVGTKEI